MGSWQWVPRVSCASCPPSASAPPSLPPSPPTSPPPAGRRTPTGRSATVQSLVAVLAMLHVTGAAPLPLPARRSGPTTSGVVTLTRAEGWRSPMTPQGEALALDCWDVAVPERKRQRDRKGGVTITPGQLPGRMGTTMGEAWRETGRIPSDRRQGRWPPTRTLTICARASASRPMVRCGATPERGRDRRECTPQVGSAVCLGVLVLMWGCHLWRGRRRPPHRVPPRSPPEPHCALAGIPTLNRTNGCASVMTNRCGGSEREQMLSLQCRSGRPDSMPVDVTPSAGQDGHTSVMTGWGGGAERGCEPSLRRQPRWPDLTPADVIPSTIRKKQTSATTGGCNGAARERELSLHYKPRRSDSAPVDATFATLRDKHNGHVSTTAGWRGGAEHERELSLHGRPGRLDLAPAAAALSIPQGEACDGVTNPSGRGGADRGAAKDASLLMRGACCRHSVLRSSPG